MTSADLVSATGLPVLCVNRCLNSLAYDCGAHLEVSSDGRLTYLFPQNLAWLYRTSALHKVLGWVTRRLAKLLFFLVRMTFGSILFVSLFVIYSVCFIVLQVLAVFFNMELLAATMKERFFNLLFSTFRLRGKNKKVPAFFENCFAFLFGPPDPNLDSEPEKWKAIANLIASNRGVVIPEQLRVWSDIKDMNRFDLSVLTRLDGMPQVTESGEILYYFPSLVSQNSNSERKKFPAWLEQKTWHFSGVRTADLSPVLGLAFMNLIGCNFAYYMVHVLPPVNKLLYAGITLLWIYGNTFLIFPLVRIFICAWRNDVITKKNVERKLLAEELLYPKEDILAKLEASRQMASEMARFTDSATVVFTTEKDSLEQFITEGV